MARTGTPLQPRRVGYAQTVVLFDPYSTSPVSPVFEVRDRAVLLTAYGLQAGETITVQTVYGPPDSEQMAPFVLDGVSFVLSTSKTSVLVNTTGRYRLLFAGDLGLDMRCTLVVQQEKSTRIPQASGVQANLPNLLLNGSIISTQSPVIEIIDKAWAFTAYDVPSGVQLTAYICVGVGADYYEEPYLLRGMQVVLDENNTTTVIPQTGRFRFKVSGDPTGIRLVGNPTKYGTVASSGAGSGVASIIPGVDVDVDNSDPANPIVGLTSDAHDAIELAKTALQGILQYSFPNGEAFSLLRGMPVCVFSGQLRLAKAVPPFDKCIGLIDDVPVLPGAFGRIRYAGVVSQPTAQWDLVTGAIGGLTAEQMYFPDDVGQLSSVPTNVAGNVVQYVGRALNSTDIVLLLGVRLGM